MSAVVGVFHRDGRPARADVLASMSAALGHRGAGEGTWLHGAVGLAHRASHTTPESAAERQPVTHHGAGLTVVADARIDNRTDLLRSLGVDRHADVGDAELILRAYERWGRDCPRRLIGDFAFAIRDQRANLVFCARDPMGVKPFYFHLSDSLFVFASEIKALLRCPGVPASIDDDQVALHVAALHEDRMATLYAQIVRLPAAQTLVVESGKSSRDTYWRVEDAPATRFSTDDQYVAAFRELFDGAVRARLRSAVPLGATLSGGLDSSSVVCAARAARDGQSSPLHTFSLVFPGHTGNDLRLIDERAFIDRVVQGGGLTPHYVRGDLLNPLADTPRVLWHLDEAHAAPNLYLHWGMFAAARDAGVRVLLDGFDGDAVVSHGFGRLTGLMRAAQWSVFEAEVRAFATHHGRTPRSVLDHYGLPYLSHLAGRGAITAWMRASRELGRRFALSRAATAWHHGLRPLASAARDGASRWIPGRSKRDLGVLHGRFGRSVEEHLTRERRESRLDAVRTEREMHIRGLSQPLYQLTLEMADKSARAFGIEPRYPFFDRRLIEFCVSVPDEQKFAGGWPRALFRRAMEGVLPREVQWRSSKGNLAPNFDRGLRASGISATAVDRAQTANLARYVDIGKLEAAGRAYERDATRGWRNPIGLMLFRVAVLNEWLSGTWRDAGPVGPADDSALHRRPAPAPATARELAGDSRRESVAC